MRRLIELHQLYQPSTKPTFKDAAFRLFPRGCTCPTGTRTCEWCVVETNGPEFAEVS